MNTSLKKHSQLHLILLLLIVFSTVANLAGASLCPPDCNHCPADNLSPACCLEMEDKEETGHGMRDSFGAKSKVPHLCENEDDQLLLTNHSSSKGVESCSTLALASIIATRIYQTDFSHTQPLYRPPPLHLQHCIFLI